MAVGLSQGCGVEETGTATTELGVLENCDYPQIFGNATHSGKACREQTGLRVVAKIVQDEDAQKIANARGFLEPHQGAPVTSGDWVIIPSRRGYTDTQHKTDRWSLQGWKWSPSVSAPGATLNKVWESATDWQAPGSIMTPTPVGGTTFDFKYTTALHSAIAGARAYTLGRFGHLRVLNTATGALVVDVNPFVGTAYDNDERTIAVSPPTVDGAGNVLYTATSFNATENDAAYQPRESWLIRVAPSGTFQRVPWSTIATAAIGIPQATDPCVFEFGTPGSTAPTGPTSQPVVDVCGTNRPAFNAAPAIANTGEIVLWSGGNNGPGSQYLIVVDPGTLTPIRAIGTSNHLRHGCGVRQDINTTRCQILTANGTTNFGTDPYSNQGGRIQFQISMTNSSPTVTPDNSLVIGGFDHGAVFGGNYDARGFGLKFSLAGALQAVNADYFYEATASVLKAPDGSYSFLMERNLWSDFDVGVAKYDSSFNLLHVGTQTTEPDYLDFLDANILFDSSGSSYGVYSDGTLYKFNAAGAAVDSVTLTNDDGTPRVMESQQAIHARDAAGRLYVSYAGNVYVVAGGGTVKLPGAAGVGVTAAAMLGKAARTASRGAPDLQ